MHTSKIRPFLILPAILYAKNVKVSQLIACVVPRQAPANALLFSYDLELETLCACRTKVLKRLHHVSADGLVLLKGKAACEIDTADELLCAELMFNGVFSGLDKHQLVALVACLIPCEKTQVSAIPNVGETCVCMRFRSPKRRM